MPLLTTFVRQKLRPSRRNGSLITRHEAPAEAGQDPINRSSMVGFGYFHAYFCLSHLFPGSAHHLVGGKDFQRLPSNKGNRGVEMQRSLLNVRLDWSPVQRDLSQAYFFRQSKPVEGDLPFLGDEGVSVLFR